MKKFLAIAPFIALLGLSSSAHAGGRYEHPHTPVICPIPELPEHSHDFSHEHDLEEAHNQAHADDHGEHEPYNPRFETGIGVDLILWKIAEDSQTRFIPQAITAETRWDFANENGSAYLVARWDLTELFR